MANVLWTPQLNIFIKQVCINWAVALYGFVRQLQMHKWSHHRCCIDLMLGQCSCSLSVRSGWIENSLIFLHCLCRNSGSLILGSDVFLNTAVGRVHNWLRTCLNTSFQVQPFSFVFTALFHVNTGFHSIFRLILMSSLCERCSGTPHRLSPLQYTTFRFINRLEVSGQDKYSYTHSKCHVKYRPGMPSRSSGTRLSYTVIWIAASHELDI